MTVLPEHYEPSLTALAAQWASSVTGPAQVAHWQERVDRLATEQAQLRAAGLWRTGGRTLLHALGLAHDEVALCRALGWLLTPDGWHGLGSSVLEQLLGHLGVPTGGADRAVVVLEEARDDTRADIVIRFEGVTVLVEAKVWALEQPTQADRLADGWQEEGPHLVFLTRTGYEPVTAVTSAGEWSVLTWAQVGQMVAAAASTKPGCAPGVAEFVATMTEYGG